MTRFEKWKNKLTVEYFVIKTFDNHVENCGYCPLCDWDRVPYEGGCDDAPHKSIDCINAITRWANEEVQDD